MMDDKATVTPIKRSTGVPIKIPKKTSRLKSSVPNNPKTFPCITNFKSFKSVSSSNEYTEKINSYLPFNGHS